MLNFALPILKREANMLDLILIEGMRAFYPKVYETVRAEFRPFLKGSLKNALTADEAGVKMQFVKLLSESKWMEGLTETERSGVHFALQVLFPHIREYGIEVTSSYLKSDSDDWEKKKRICADNYFRRYFSYGIVPNDISDREIEEFINSLGKTDIEQLTVRLETFCSGNRAGTLIQKLRIYEDKIAAEYAGKLAIAIARRSDLIPEVSPNDNFAGAGALLRTAVLLKNLIGRIEDAATRRDVAKDVMKAIESLRLAHEFFGKIRKFKGQGSEALVGIVSDKCEQEIARIFAEKLAQIAESQPFEDSGLFSKERFYLEWRLSDPESLCQYARHRLESRPEDVGKFLEWGSFFSSALQRLETT
jgi:predicted KAP-like P-loop ATPase